MTDQYIPSGFFDLVSYVEREGEWTFTISDDLEGALMALLVQKLSNLKRYGVHDMDVKLEGNVVTVTRGKKQ